MANIICEVIHVVRLRTGWYTHTIVEVLYWIAWLTTSYRWTIASLAISIAKYTIACCSISVLSKGARCNAYLLSHKEILISNRVGVHLWCTCWANWVALAHKKIICRIFTNHAVSIQSSITNLTRWVTTNTSNLDVVDFLCLQIGVVSIVVSDTSEELNIGE